MKKLVALLMALAMVFTMVSCKKDNVLSYEEYAETELDEEVVVEGYVQDTHGWWEDKLTLYLQDEDGAYFVSEVLIDGESYGRGEGFSKRESQQNAAEEALKKLS